MKAARVILASANPGKLRELQALLAPLGFELTPQELLGIESAPETGATFLANALIKARHAAGERGLPAIADDSGIEVDALAGAPGVRSARYAGDAADDRQNLRRKSPRQPLLFTERKLFRLAHNAPLGSAVGNVDDGALD